IFLLLLYYFFFFFLLLQLLPRFTLFPYTTLFRSTAKDISNVVTDAASGVVDIFHGIDKAVADTWNNFWKDGKADGIGNSFINTMRSEERFSRNAETDIVCCLLLEKKKPTSTYPTRQLL